MFWECKEHLKIRYIPLKLATFPFTFHPKIGKKFFVWNISSCMHEKSSGCNGKRGWMWKVNDCSQERVIVLCSWAKRHWLSPVRGIIGYHFIRSESDKMLGDERILAMELLLIQERCNCSNALTCRKRREIKCRNYASWYRMWMLPLQWTFNPDLTCVCFADPDGTTSHAASISGR